MNRGKVNINSIFFDRIYKIVKTNLQMQHCSNCDKSLPVQKFHLHEGYCRRNIKRCPLCNLPCDLNNIEEHNDQYHKIQKCSYCQESFNINEIKYHLKNCLAKPIVCNYCELSVPVSKFQTHRTQCQAKTSHCQLCHKLILNKETMGHKNKCLGLIEKQREIERNFSQEKQQAILKKQEKKKTNSSQGQQCMDLNNFLFQTQDKELQAALLASLDFSYWSPKVEVKNS